MPHREGVDILGKRKLVTLAYADGAAECLLVGASPHFKGQIHRRQHGDKSLESWISSRRCGFV